jgi:predicted esterase
MDWSVVESSLDAGEINGEETADRVDPRFRFAWWNCPSGRAGRPLIVAVHGSGRDYRETGEAFLPLAKAHDASVMAPLFPRWEGEGGGDGYKFLHEPGADYVALLDRMLDSLAAEHRYDPARVYLFGFSGGGQFVHRYAIARASRLAGLVVAAPGSVTLLEENLPWWAGLSGMKDKIGHAPDLAGLAALPVHLVIGDRDVDNDLIGRPPGHPYHSPYADHAGAGRQARLKALKASLEERGVSVSLDLLPGVNHELAPVAAAAASRIDQWMKQGR